MTATAHTLIREDRRPYARGLHEVVEQAIAQLRDASPARTTSISLTLPPSLLPPTAELSVDTFWHSPDAGGDLLARGTALRLANANAEVFVRRAADWQCVGENNADCSPRAFFTVPALARPVQASICWPAVQIRRLPHADTVAFTANLDTPPGDIATQWRREWRALLTQPASRGPSRAIVTRQSMTPPAGEWLSAVEATRAEIARGQFQKAVLTRRLTLELQSFVDPMALARRLVPTHPDCHVFAIPYDGGHVVAASPERLVEKHGDTVVCDALAGTARRADRAEDDERESARLMHCPKQRHEHALVVKGIVAALAGISPEISAAREPQVRRLRSLLHLWTEITARVQRGQGLLDIVSRLHPTAAVVGFPFEGASRWLQTLGEQRDGLYTGVAGCIDRRGDGEAIVVLRSAHLRARSAVLWAGAGIVAGSQPLSELHEIDLKLDTMREALGCA